MSDVRKYRSSWSGSSGSNGRKPSRSHQARAGGVQRGDDDRSAGGLLVELDGGHKHMRGERSPDTEVRVAAVDRGTAQQECRDRIWRASAATGRRGRAIDAGHRDARVCDDDSLDIGDNRRSLTSAGRSSASLNATAACAESRMLNRSARISSAFEAAAWTTNAETFRCEAAAVRSSNACLPDNPDLQTLFLGR
jgi:hypothetical protein